MAAPILRGLPKRLPGGGVGSRTQILGVPAALAKLKAVDAAAKLQLAGSMRSVGEFIEKRAQENVHSESGNLRSGIQSKQIGPFTYNVTASSMDGNNPDKNWYEYADFVEFGTREHGPAQLYMTRAFEEAKPIAAAELKAIGRTLERV